MGESGKNPKREAAAELWRYYAGKELPSDYLRDELARLIDTHGRETVKVALQEYAKSNGERFSYFEKILQTVLKKKGGKKDERKPIERAPTATYRKPQRATVLNKSANLRKSRRRWLFARIVRAKVAEKSTSNITCQNFRVMNSDMSYANIARNKAIFGVQ